MLSGRLRLFKKVATLLLHVIFGGVKMVMKKIMLPLFCRAKVKLGIEHFRAM